MFFNQKYLENTLGVVINLFMALKNQKHHPKNQNQYKTKNQIKLRFVVTSTFKVKNKKHLIWTHLIKYNHLIQILIILVAYISANDTLLSLPPESDGLYGLKNNKN
jgi:hypothetical protein